MSTVWIRAVYAAVVAVLAAFTVIFGIAMVSPGPKPPGDPGITFRQLSGDDERSQNTLQQQIETYYGDAARFRNQYPGYQRNVFLAATGFGVLFVLVGLALPSLINYLRLGLVLGGLLVFIYAFYIAMRPVPVVTPQGTNLLAFIGAGFPEPLNFAGRFARFAVSFIGFILALFVGLWRLTEWPSAQRRMAPRPATAPAMPPPGMATPAMAAAGPASPWAPPPSHTPAPAMAATAPGVSPWAPPSHLPPTPASGEGVEGARGEAGPVPPPGAP